MQMGDIIIFCLRCFRQERIIRKMQFLKDGVKEILVLLYKCLRMDALYRSMILEIASSGLPFSPVNTK